MTLQQINHTKGIKERNIHIHHTSSILFCCTQEAFNMIDTNRDGYIDKDDLLELMISLGKDPSNEYLDKMVNEAPGPINFTMFLTLFGDKLNGTDPEEVIKNAFQCFDDKNLGMIINFIYPHPISRFETYGKL